MGSRVLLPEYFFNLYFFEYSSTFKIKVLVLVLEYYGLELVPNTDYTSLNEWVAGMGAIRLTRSQREHILATLQKLSFRCDFAFLA